MINLFGNDFAIVTAVTPEYRDALYWAAPSWAVKPQFADKALIVFHNGFKDAEKSLAFLSALPFPSVRLIEWAGPAGADLREKMLSAFVLGAAVEVYSEHFVKLDADCFFTDAQDVFTDEDFGLDLVSQKWHYTKPGRWIDILAAWSRGEPCPGGKGDNSPRRTARIISFCCLHKTEFVRKATALAGARLPVPSHDTYLWWLADNCRDFSWAARDLKARGIGHNRRWKHIREEVCASPAAWNSVHGKILLDHIQLEITTACNLSCPNCDRACGIAPSAERMTLEQVQRFVAESISSGKTWARIDILGGEPTLHPDLLPILDAVRPVARRVRLTTNGTGDRVKGVIATLPEWVQVRNSSGEKSAPNFEAYNLAPIDYGFPAAKACSIPWRCGLALTRHGYFLCGAGAAVNRVFGLDVGIQSLPTLNVDALKQQAEALCKYCGHSRSTGKQTTMQETSPAWEAAVKNCGNVEMKAY